MFRVTGIEHAVNMIMSAARNHPDKIARQLKVSGKQIESRAKKKAPKDTGDLIRSIISESPEKYRNVTTANMDYAPFVEFGTGSKVSVQNGFQEMAIQFKGKGIKKINRKPQPYLVPAFLEVLPEFKAECQKIIQS
jgi:HK97 gp10 family phage protein